MPKPRISELRAGHIRRSRRKPQARDPMGLIEGAQADAARMRGWLSMGKPDKAEAALDRAMLALTDAEENCPAWALPAIEQVHAELDTVAARMAP